jgi:glycosyltransferase involved in cell wall biosynthesis
VRILHVVTAFPRFPDDIISPWLVELLKRMRAAGHEVEVFAPAYRGGGNRNVDGIPVYRFRYFPARWEDLTHDQGTPDRVRRSLRYKIMPLFYAVGGMLAIWRLCRRRSYDIVHVHWPVPHALFGWAARRACGAAMVTLWYGVELRWVKGRLPWLKAFLRWALKTSDQVVAISSATAREIAELGHKSVWVIPYAVGFAAAPGALPARRSRGADEPFVVLFVGNLIERKGVSYLIDAVHRLSRRVPVRLLILGKGEGLERSRLEQQVKTLGLEDRVEMPGRVPEPELHRAFGRAQVLVLPSIVDARGDTEGLGVVLLEAMSYRLPVIASNVGGITDIVEDGKTGLLVPPADPAALAGALERLATDAPLAAQLAEDGRQYVREHFSWPAILEEWQVCYAAAVTARGQGA